MHNLTPRDSLTVLTLPLQKNVEIIRMENVAVRINRRFALDLGSLCYATRSMKKREKNKGRPVDLASHLPQRLPALRTLLNVVDERAKSGAWRPDTMATALAAFDTFLYWCDSTGRTDALIDVINARQAYRDYVAVLRQKLSARQTANDSAVRSQNYARMILEDLFETYDFNRGVNWIARTGGQSSSVPVPASSDVGKVLAIAVCLFDGYCDLLLNHRHYPYALKVPEYLEWPDNTLWIFPSVRWCIPPDKWELIKRGELDGGFGAVKPLFDYGAGEVLDDSVRSHGYVSIHTAARSKQLALSSLVEANTNPYSWHRLSRGTSAVQAFFVILTAATGMNLTQLMDLPWSEEFEYTVSHPEVEAQGLRGIKYRAGGRQVHFNIQAQYIGYLRKYLKLRAHLLNGRQFDYLFFNYGGLRKGSLVPQRPSANFESDFKKQLRRLSAKIPRVTPQQFRLKKQDLVITHFDPVTAAAAMQHSVRTALKKYSRGSDEVAQEEMGTFFARMEETVVDKGVVIPGEQPRALGSCISEGNPQAITDSSMIQPDCRQSEGCLFCQNHRVHADEPDLRKLHSAHYVLRQTAHFAESAEDHELVCGHILKRIDFIVVQIKSKGPTMVALSDSVKKEVDVEGNLDTYWAGQLEYLWSLEELL